MDSDGAPPVPCTSLGSPGGRWARFAMERWVGHGCGGNRLGIAIDSDAPAGPPMTQPKRTGPSGGPGRGAARRGKAVSTTSIFPGRLIRGSAAQPPGGRAGEKFRSVVFGLRPNERFGSGPRIGNSLVGFGRQPSRAPRSKGGRAVPGTSFRGPGAEQKHPGTARTAITKRGFAVIGQKSSGSRAAPAVGDAPCANLVKSTPPRVPEMAEPAKPGQVAGGGSCGGPFFPVSRSVKRFKKGHGSDRDGECR